MPLSKTSLLSALMLLFFAQQAAAQIICITCYPQEETVSPAAPNFLLNGSLENLTNSSGNNYICPNSSFYTTDIDDWTCTDGGTNTYAASVTSQAFFKVVDGTRAAYLGNSFCQICSNTNNDTSCLSQVDCEMVGIPAGFPMHGAAYGGSNGVSMSQTVSNLTVGNKYILEFWAGGEGSSNIFLQDGLFGLDIGFGYNYLRCQPTGASGSPLKGMRYVVQFRATQASHTVKFTNWGHICSDCTELIVDDIKLYNLSELNPNYEACPNDTIGGGGGGGGGIDTIDTFRFAIDTTLCVGESFTFNGVVYQNAGRHTIEIPEGDSVLNIYNISILMEDCYTFVVPNAFTPNGDGKNDILVPVTNNFFPADYSMKIFNRFGQMVFETNDYTIGWDGTFGGEYCPISTYYYFVTFKMSSSDNEIKRGDILLIR